MERRKKTARDEPRAREADGKTVKPRRKKRKRGMLRETQEIWRNGDSRRRGKLEEEDEGSKIPVRRERSSVDGVAVVSVTST